VATSIFNMIPDAGTSDATWVTFASAVSAALTAAGFSQTTDTGQVTWASQTRVSATLGTYYEIRKFTDAAQSTNPFFIRIDYFVVSSVPEIAITVGTATNGAGTINANASQRITVFDHQSTSTFQGYLRYDTSSIQLAFGQSATVTDTACGSFFSISRTVDSTGAYNSTGVNIIVSCSAVSSSMKCQFTGSTGPNPASATQGCTCAIPNLTSTATNTTFGFNWGLFPVYPNTGPLGNPDLSAFFFSNLVLAKGNLMEIVIPMYGTNHTYIGLMNLATTTTAGGGSTDTLGIFMRWE
jgi:hypothetical protein